MTIKTTAALNFLIVVIAAVLYQYLAFPLRLLNPQIQLLLFISFPHQAILLPEYGNLQSKFTIFRIPFQSLNM